MATDITSIDGGQRSLWAKAEEGLKQTHNQAGIIVRLTSLKTAVVRKGGDFLLYRFCRKGRQRRPEWHLEGKALETGKLQFKSKRAASNYDLAMVDYDLADFALGQLSFKRHVSDTRDFRNQAKNKEIEFAGKHFCRGAEWIRGNIGIKQDQCLFFPGAVIHRPASVKWNFIRLSAARLMLLLTDGPDATGVVRHKCGMGHMSCCNPDHLMWGSSMDNAADRELHNKFWPPHLVSKNDADAIRSDSRLVKIIAHDMQIPAYAVSSIKLASMVG